MSKIRLNYVRKASALTLLLAALAGMICGCTSEELTATEVFETAASVEAQPVETETVEAAEATESMQIRTIETAYIPLQVSNSYMQELTYSEVIEGEIAMEIFSMQVGDAQLELFRIYFNDRETGTMIGNLNIGEKLIPVTVAVPEYSAESFQDETLQELYYSSMDVLTEVLRSIRTHEAFADENTVVVEVKDTTVSYWTFSLPEGISWEESRENGDYSISFYGTFNGEKVDLYTVAVSEEILTTVLGTYTAEGETKPISIKCYDLPDTTEWEQTDVAQLYTMMDTINDVIQVITSSEGFSAEIPEA